MHPQNEPRTSKHSSNERNLAAPSDWKRFCLVTKFNHEPRLALSNRRQKFEPIAYCLGYSLKTSY